MNRLPITLDEMSAAIAELHATLPKFGLTTENAPVVARAYREALMPLDREAVAGGAKLGLRLWDKFPPPKAWRGSYPRVGQAQPHPAEGVGRCCPR